MEAPDKRDVERHRHRLRVRRPKAAHDSLVFGDQRVLPSGYEGWTDGRISTSGVREVGERDQRKWVGKGTGKR